MLDTHDWTMEQHEAAAAALGLFAAHLMKLGAPAVHSGMHAETVGFAAGLSAGTDQAARWMARRAYRHAAAVLREAERKADYLNVVCCVCGVTIRKGLDGGPVSHGYCPTCEAAALAEVERLTPSDIRD